MFSYQETHRKKENDEKLRFLMGAILLFLVAALKHLLQHIKNECNQTVYHV